MMPYTCIWLRDADAAQSHVFLPANELANSYTGQIYMVYPTKSFADPSVTRITVARGDWRKRNDLDEIIPFVIYISMILNVWCP